VRATARSIATLGSASTPAGTVKRLRVALGTLVAIEATCDAATQPVAAEAIEAAFTAITTVGHRLHPHSPGSDLFRINGAPPGTAVTVHESTCDLLDLARRLNVLTDGAFDPCLPSHAGRLSDIEIAGNQVLVHVPAALDFGGFAKGYAVDRAIAALRSHGCSSGLVNAGGDMRVFGPSAERVLLRGPGNRLAEIRLADAALAVSDADSEHRPAEHQGYYVREAVSSGTHTSEHSDPLVVRYAAVVAKETVLADALAKCVLLCPREVATRALHVFAAEQLVDQ